MYMTYICILIALLSVLSNDAFPYSFYSDDIPSSSLDTNLYLKRREVFDPYGFNSILSRFVKRDQMHKIQKRKIIRLIRQDIYDII
ncbi:unnamed protein product [Adineta steineri]|uniref:Uncharacterized protein n=1 Tax=Adineta steineri TaxID=433720 RepID=A0A818Z9J1_9BILA|nr:unnamed protein product [Adineta steineri]CAF3763881.1 unnamed protein product [Adineta steineri]